MFKVKKQDVRIETKQTQAKPNITPKIIKSLDSLVQSSSADRYLFKVCEKYVRAICRSLCSNSPFSYVCRSSLAKRHPPKMQIELVTIAENILNCNRNNLLQKWYKNQNQKTKMMPKFIENTASDWIIQKNITLYTRYFTCRWMVHQPCSIVLNLVVCYHSLVS